MKFIKLMITSVLLATPLVLTNHSPQAATVQQASNTSYWANVNNITFTDEHAMFNSGVAKLEKNVPVKVNAVVRYSGDMAAIEQSAVIFENVSAGLAIDYDGLIEFNGKQATFSFTVTLLESTTSTKLFTVKVADGVPGDRKHLTPYSQRQTIEEKASAKIESTKKPVELPEVNYEVIEEPKPESEVEKETSEQPKEENNLVEIPEPEVEVEKETTEQPEVDGNVIDKPDTKIEQNHDEQPEKETDYVEIPEPEITPEKEANEQPKVVGNQLEQPNPEIEKIPTKKIKEEEQTTSTTDKNNHHATQKNVLVAEATTDVAAQSKAIANTAFASTSNLPSTGESLKVANLSKILGGIAILLAATIYLFSNHRSIHFRLKK